MTKQELIDALIEDHGRLYSEDIGADIARDEPQQWFHWLLCSLLMSARISAENAVEAARALKENDLHKPDALRGADRSRLVQLLNENGYARYDNQGADYLKAAAERVGATHDDDLRKLRDAARDRDEIVAGLTAFKGIGEVGANIFAREAQIAWDELYPTLNGPAASQAAELGLPDKAEALSEAAGGRERFTRLVAALTRASLNSPSDRVKEAAT